MKLIQHAPQIGATALDMAFLAMQPEDMATSLAYYQLFLESNLFLLLAEESTEEKLVPFVFSTDAGPCALVFDQEERLADFIHTPQPYATLSGRSLLYLLGKQKMGIGVNIGQEEVENLMLPEVVEWLGQMLEQTPTEDHDKITHVSTSLETEEIFAPVLQQMLHHARGLCEHMGLAYGHYAQGSARPVLVVVGALRPFHDVLATALHEALLFSQNNAYPLDIAFIASQDPLAKQLEQVTVCHHVDPLSVQDDVP